MKTQTFASFLFAAACAGVLLSSCEKPTEQRTVDEESPATLVSPSEPVPQPTEVRKSETEAADEDEP